MHATATVDRAVYPHAAAAPERTLLDVLAATVSAHPGALALDDGRVRLTYRRLAGEVAALAGELAQAGVGAGDRVGVRIASGTADLYVAILAVLTAGAAYVPTDVDDPDERAELVWSEAGVCGVLRDGRHLVLRDRLPPRGERRPPGPENDAWIIFTSGSTGTPKGVAVSHRSAAAFVDAEAQLFCPDRPLGPGDRVMAGLSVAFDASCEEMWLAWRHGATLVPAPRALVRAGSELGTWLVDHAVTVVSTVPTLAALWPAQALESVRLLILGGEACPAELVSRLDDGSREVWNTYGPTETTVVACAARVRGGEPVRIGLPLAGWELAVVGADGRAVGWGEVGELVIAGAGMGRYLEAAKDTLAFAPVADLGWPRAYRTGDRVRAEPEGLVFVGRVDDQVKIGGRRIELGEIDAALRAAPQVSAAAAAVRTTSAGIPIVIGYVVPDGGAEFRPETVRSRLAGELPAALVPVIAVVEGLPSTTSGKVDREALPWPLPRPETADGAGPGAPGTASGSPAPVGSMAWLAWRWSEFVGPVPVAEDTDFFASGGSSLAAAQLASVLRADFPGLSVADLYRHPTLSEQVGWLAELGGEQDDVPPVTPTPVSAGLVQLAVMLGVLGYLALRWLTVIAAVGNLLPPRPWTPGAPWWVVVASWVVLFSAPGRTLTAVAGARVLLRGVVPGSYRRGGSVHLRLWAAQQLAAVCGLSDLAGTPWAPRLARALGCQVGRGVALHAPPPLTGLADLGDGCAVDSGADLAGWWLDGDLLRVGRVRVGPGARIGARSTLMPGAEVGALAEVAAGSCVSGAVPPQRLWAGSPAVDAGPAGVGWPRPRRRTTRWHAAYAAALLGRGLLPLLCALPGLLVVYRYLIPGHFATLQSTLWALLVCVPVAVVLYLLASLMVTAGLVRAAGSRLRPGLYPDDGGVAWCAWLVEGLMAGARTAFFPLYASLLTPAWLRALGARVGSRVEASTVLALPGLARVDDGGFLADDAMLGHPERWLGWIRLGPAEVGRRAFVGNSAIVGPGTAVPDGALIGVLSAAPEEARPGSTWLGLPPLQLPRVVADADVSRTFEPPRRLVAARAAIETCRLLPMMISLALADVLTVCLTWVIWQGGPLVAVVAAVPLLFVAGALACLIATAAKWVLVGRVRTQEQPLWSSFVWRNELADIFVEQLAVPWLARLTLGTPLFAAWMRSMGARIGRGVWFDTYWLPEPDLIDIGDGAGINRGCVIQTHLFHDRIMRLDHVRLGAGTTVGPHSIVLPGATVGADTAIGGGSLVMRGESVPASTRWLGNPIAPRPGARPRSRPDLTAAARARSRSAAPVRIARRAPELLADVRARPTPQLSRRSLVSLSLFSLDLCRSHERELFGILREEERRHALSMAPGSRRSTYIASRAVVRLLLSTDLQAASTPADVRLATGEGGKLVVGDPGSTAIDLSIAHSEELLAVALSDVYDVGVDVEPYRHGNPGDIAWSAVSRYEHAYLLATPAEERAWQFRRMWTLKEALAKCLGAGTAIDFADLDTFFDCKPLTFPSLDAARPQVTDGDAEPPPWLEGVPQWFHQEQWGVNGSRHWVAVAARRRDLPRRLDQIAGHFRSQIQTGELRAGDRLPTVTEIAENWDVARQTAGGAVASLQSDGLVTTAGRVGTVVTERASVGSVAISLEEPPGVVITGADVERASAGVAQRLGVRPGSAVIIVRMARRVRDKRLTGPPKH